MLPFNDLKALCYRYTTNIPQKCPGSPKAVYNLLFRGKEVLRVLLSHSTLESEYFLASYIWTHYEMVFKVFVSVLLEVKNLSTAVTLIVR